ncbi:MAG TPA: FG-GAP-like repeat-containing protein [bacterium]|nr:FG-GAP-like repeat-containing protein [bacterium]
MADSKKTAISYSPVSQDDFERLKKTFGVYVTSKNYNKIINGRGTGLRPPTEEEWNSIKYKIKGITSVKYSPKYSAPLPAAYDNTQEIWFPPIGDQGSEGSCSSWSIAYYCKTFQEAKEHNWNLKNALPSGVYQGSFPDDYADKIFSPDFLYHLVNKNNDVGSMFWYPIRLMYGIGAATFKTMPYKDYDHTSLPVETAWREAALYRNETDYFIIDSQTDTNFVNLKTLLNSNIIAAIAIDAYNYESLTADSELWTLDNYNFPLDYNHANTIVGYDDNFGPYLEEGDTRYGAFKIVNSWGVGWTGDRNSDGCYWISYNALRKTVPFIQYFIDKTAYKPEILAGFSITHNSRIECDITIGLGNPENSIITKKLTDYLYLGDMSFDNYKFLVDITEFKNDISNNTVFLQIYDKDLTSNTGVIHGFELEFFNDYSIFQSADTIFKSPQVQVKTINDSSIVLYLTANDKLNRDTFPLQTPVITFADTSQYDIAKIYWTKPLANTNGDLIQYDGASGYKIYRSDNPAENKWEEKCIAEKFSIDDTEYIDNLLSENIPNFFRVKAYTNKIVNGVSYYIESGYSPVFTLKTLIKPYTVNNKINLPELAGLYRSDMDLGDFNNDGLIDITVCGYDYTNTILKIYKNTGDTFVLVSEPLGSLKGVMRGSVKFADINNDGALDLIALGNGGQYNRLLVFENRNGEFVKLSEPMGANKGLQNGYIAAADFDNDGDVDFAVTGNDGSNNRFIIFWNDKKIFARYTEPAGHNFGLTDYSRIIAGDYNNDGFKDLCCAGYDGAHSRLVLLKNNNGVFSFDQEPLGINKGLDYCSIDFGDYDNDGDLDLAAAGFGEECERFVIFKNNNGTFQKILEPLGENKGFYDNAIKFGDYNGDGLLDIAAQGESSAGLKYFAIYENIGADSFVKKFEPLGTNQGIFLGSCNFADADNNGSLDLFATGRYSYLISSVFKNNFQIQNTRPTPPSALEPKSVEIEQGDSIVFKWTKGTDSITPQSSLSYNIRIGKTQGGSEIISADSNSNHIGSSVLYGNVQFNASYILNSEKLEEGIYYWSVQTLDNGMMKSVWTAEDTFKIVLPSGADTTAPAAPVLISADTSIFNRVVLAWSKPVLSEFGGSLENTDTDLAGYKIYRSETGNVQNWNNCLIAVVSNRNSETFTDTAIAENAIYYYRITAYDSTSRKNMIFNNESEFSNIINARIQARPALCFTSADTIDLSVDFIELNRTGFELYDFDGDGDLDAVMAGNDGSTPRFIIYENRNNRYYQIAEPMGRFNGLDYFGSFEFADYNNDGKPDLIASGYDFENRLIAYKNDNNKFVKDYTLLGENIGVSSSFVKSADFDNDGDLDLAVTGYGSSNYMCIIFKNENGVLKKYSEPMTTNIGLDDSANEWIDIDNDGELDLIVSGNDSFNNRLIIFRNESNVFTKISEPFGFNKGISKSCISSADIDNDGDIDFAVIGYDGSNYRFVIFENQNGNFTLKDEPLGVNKGLYRGSIKFADYDNDGFVDLAVSGGDGNSERLIFYKNYNGKFILDCEPLGANAGLNYSKIFWTDWDKDNSLDLFITGRNSSGDQKCFVFLNQSPVKNIRPSAPVIVEPAGNVFIAADSVTFKWNKVNSDTTPSIALNYNLRIGRKSGGCEIMSVITNTNNLFDLTLKGNVQNHNEWTLKNNAENRLTNGVYYWSVQAVDGGLMKSEWSSEKMFAIADTIYVLNSSETLIVLSEKLTDVSPAAAITLSNTEPVNINFNIGDSSTVYSGGISLKLKPDKLNSVLTISKMDKNQYNKGTELLNGFDRFSNTIIDLILTDTQGNIISSDSSFYSVKPVLTYSLKKSDFTAEEIQRLRIMTFDENSNKWILAGITDITSNGETVFINVSLNHFSVYGLFFTAAPAFANTSENIIVYPNPYIPNDNDALNGTPTSGILFGNLPANSNIEIYTVAGKKVFSQTVNETPFRWNVKNNDGRDIASGIYFFVVKSSAGVKTGKFAVIK